MNILQKIEKYNNNKYKEISKLLNFKKDYKIDFIKKDNGILIGFYDNNKLLFNGSFNFYGVYHTDNKLWIWASSIPGINSKQINKINKLKAFNYLFENTNDDKINFYYQLLTQDVILINNEVQLDWINNLLIYLSDDLYYFNPINSSNNIQFLGLTKIKEKYI